MVGALTRVREGIWRSLCRATCLCHLEYIVLAVLLNLSPVPASLRFWLCWQLRLMDLARNSGYSLAPWWPPSPSLACSWWCLCVHLMLLTPLFKQTSICALTVGRVDPSLPELHSLWWNLSETYFPYAWNADVAPARAKPSTVTHQERPYLLAEEAQGACTIAFSGDFPDYPWAHSDRTSLKRGRQEKGPLQYNVHFFYFPSYGN